MPKVLTLKRGLRKTSIERSKIGLAVIKTSSVKTSATKNTDNLIYKLRTKSFSQLPLNSSSSYTVRKPKPTITTKIKVVQRKSSK